MYSRRLSRGLSVSFVVDVVLLRGELLCVQLLDAPFSFGRLAGGEDDCFDDIISKTERLYQSSLGNLLDMSCHLTGILP